MVENVGFEERPADSCRLTIVTNIRATGRFRPPVDFQLVSRQRLGNGEQLAWFNVIHQPTGDGLVSDSRRSKSRANSSFRIEIGQERSPGQVIAKAADSLAQRIYIPGQAKVGTSGQSQGSTPPSTGMTASKLIFGGTRSFWTRNWRRLYPSEPP